MYMKWLKEPNRKQVNAELQRLFNAPGNEAARELDSMLPTELQRIF
jgi:hypothetical protein